MADILTFYDANMHVDAGTATVDRSHLKASLQTGLLHLVYYLMYTAEGRNFLREQRPSDTTPVRTADDVRSAIQKKCTEYGVSGQAVDAMIGAHFAGIGWVEAYGNNNVPERNKQEAVFKQNLALISWLLWEEGSGPLFPLPW